jgi:nickel transport protein
MHNFSKLWSVGLAAILLAPVTAGAHGIWIAERHGTQAVVYGHGASDEAYDPQKLKTVSAKDMDGEAVAVEIRRQDDHALLDVPENAVVVSTIFDNGFWAEGPDGKWVNKPKAEVPGAKQSSKSQKFAVAILDHLRKKPQAQGLPFEIVPLMDPTILAAGNDLPVQVLFDGKPVKGVSVTADYVTDSHAAPVKTNAEGIATIKIRNAGLNVVGAAHSSPTPDSSDADKLSYFTTLTFNLDQHHHD